MRQHLVLLTCCWAAMQSCVAVDQALVDKNVAELENLQPPPGRSTLVLAWPSALKTPFGPARLEANIFIDELAVDSMGDYEFALIHLPPGPHTIRALTAGAGASGISTVKLVVLKPAEVRVVELVPKLSWSAPIITFDEKPNDLDQHYRIANCRRAFEIDLGAQSNIPPPPL